MNTGSLSARDPRLHRISLIAGFLLALSLPCLQARGQALGFTLNDPRVKIPWTGAGTGTWQGFLLANPTALRPITYQGQVVRDSHNAGGCSDVTHGQSGGYNAADDLASGYNDVTTVPCWPVTTSSKPCCGTFYTGAWAFYPRTTPGNPNPNYSYLMMRMRVDGDPRDNGNGFLNSHFTFVIDGNGDGFTDYMLLVQGGGSAQLFWASNQGLPVAQQSMDVPNFLQVPGTSLDGFGNARPRAWISDYVLCNNDTAVGCTNSIVRATPATDSPDTTDWFIDVQVNFAALTPYNGLGACTVGDTPCWTWDPRRPDQVPADNQWMLGVNAQPEFYVAGSAPTSIPPGLRVNLFTGASNGGPMQKDNMMPCTPGIAPAAGTSCGTLDNTPVTLSYFRATRGRGGIRFDWSTAVEAGNAGFDLYARAEKGGWFRVNDKLVPSSRVDSLTRTDYTYEAAGLDGVEFRIEDVDIHGERREHGSYLAEKEYGSRVPAPRVDWASVRSESGAKLAQRSESARAAALSKSRGAGALVRGGTPAALAGFPVFDLRVSADGLYRVTHEALVAAGLDLSGVPPSQLAVVGREGPIAVRVETGSASGKKALFGPGSFIEFYGTAARSLYTRKNVYRLVVDPAQAMRVSVDAMEGGKVLPAKWYLETAEVQNDRSWSFASPNGDPWYDQMVLAYTTPVSRQLPIQIDNLVGSGNGASVRLGAWGVTDWPTIGNDHHVQLALNGTSVGETSVDGTVDAPIEASVPTGLLHEGSNTLTMTLPGDTGVAYDLVALDKYSVTYPRSFVARGGVLAFTSAEARFEVGGLPAPDAVVYRIGEKKVEFVSRLAYGGAAGNHSVSFRGTGEKALYVVASPAALGVPELGPTPDTTGLTVGPAQYLVISHPDFVGGLSALVNARAAQGMSVKVVSVDDVYTRFGGGVLDPEAIRRFVGFAAANMGTQYVVLVGGDSYDYLNHLGTGSVSFIPTLYTRTHTVVNFTPADSLFADITGDKIADLAIGRLPVRSAADLAAVIAKTLQYPTVAARTNAVFAADREEAGGFFRSISNDAVSQLPTGWSTQTAYIDDLGVAGARSALIGAINGGASLVNYIGHSDTTFWSFDNLFTSADANALTNSGWPTLITQWGCWNTFYSTPDASTLSDRLMLPADRGAAAVIGPSALGSVDGEKVMSALLANKMSQPGTTIGMALQAARAQVHATQPWLVDVTIGTNLLGDPALRLVP